MSFLKKEKGIIITVIVLILIAFAGQYVEKLSIVKSTDIITPMDHSNGIITFVVPKDFGLALKKDEIHATAYIPPCDESFDFCLYYNGIKYIGTNFGSAGVRIKNRSDLKTAVSCLNTSPDNYTSAKSTVVASTTIYSVSAFPGIGDAGAGHYASGELLRLAYDGTCHEFETRVAASQYANFAEGSIKEFTANDSKELLKELRDIISRVTLKGGEKISF